MQTDSRILADALRAAGFDIFTDRRSDALSRAVDCLSGRTHYVDADTRRFFRARVLSSQVLCNGLFFGMLESSSANAGHTARIFRPVFFDIFGTVVSRPSIENAYKSREGARREFWRIADTLNPAEHYREVLQKRADRMQRDADALRAIIGGL